MSHQVGAEEVLFSDEFNLNYFGYNGGNDIVAWPPASAASASSCNGPVDTAPIISVTAVAGRVSSIAALDNGSPSEHLARRSVVQAYGQQKQ